MGKTNATRNSTFDRKSTGGSQLKDEERRKKIAELAAKADKQKRHKSEPLPFDAKAFIIHTDSPEDRYDIWHKELGAFKREHLKGNVYEAHRAEICRFMKKGKEKGADSKMAPHSLMQEASDACRKWLAENGGQDSMELLATFEELNKRWALQIEGGKVIKKESN